MRLRSIFARLSGVESGVVERVVEEGETLVVHARPRAKQANRCSRCGRRCAGYDGGGGRRRWRGLDLGTLCVHIEAHATRVRCPEHGVVVAAVPWARPGSRFTRAFEDTVAWLACRTDKTTVCQLMRIAWRTVGRICEQVVAQARSDASLDGLRRIGIDEVSYKRRHKYLTVVVDHDTGRLVWAGEGKDLATIDAFFAALGKERARQLELISADAWGAVRGAIKRHCPQATLCLDPFHIVMWATEAVDQVRRQIWADLRKAGEVERPLDLQRSRFVLWKNPENLTDPQRATLSSIQRLNRPLYRAYLLKEQLRMVFKTKGKEGQELLERWLRWAARCRIEPFVSLGKRIRKHRKAIRATLEHGLSNARVEAANTSIRLLTRLAFGFHSANSLIALAFLRLGGCCPPLPRASSPTK